MITFDTKAQALGRGYGAQSDRSGDREPLRVLVELAREDWATFMILADNEADRVFQVAVDVAPGFKLDVGYAPIPATMPTWPFYGGLEVTFGRPILPEPSSTSVVVRGELTGSAYEQSAALAQLQQNNDVVGVFADLAIVPFATCLTDPAVGTMTDVQALMDASMLRQAGMAGSGVTVAVVDTGFNCDYLRARHMPTNLGPAGHHFAPDDDFDGPGEHLEGHGTMCAYDVSILAPDASFLDHAVLLTQLPGANVIERLTSDALRSYAVLQNILADTPVGERRMVVTNSWGVDSLANDFSPGTPGNFSDDRRHVFTRAVQALVNAGADVVFAAGNCGPRCPHESCDFGDTPAICGAASAPEVTCVGAVDVHRQILGYSSVGPGRLDPLKPDLTAYAHFDGSGVGGYPDGGTSAACPVYAGLVAAVRSKYSSAELAPAQLRAIVKSCCVDLGQRGFDHEHGSGVPNVGALLQALF